MAHTRCMLDKQDYTHAHAHTNAPGHSHTHARAYTDKCNTYCFSTATVIREHGTLLRYTYIACLVTYYE
jgi:hypothetical protein